MLSEKLVYIERWQRCGRGSIGGSIAVTTALTAVGMGLTGSLITPCVRAEETPPKDPALVKKELAAALARAEADKAQAEADKAEAKRALFESKLPSSESKGLEGETELDGVAIEANIQAYRALQKAVGKIVTKIELKAKDAKDIVILNANDVQAMKASRVTEKQIDFLVNQYNWAFSFGNQPDIQSGGSSGGALLLPQMVASGLGALGDIAAFFRTDTKISGVDVNLDKSAVIPELVRQLSERLSAVAVYYPEIYPYKLASVNQPMFLDGKVKELEALYERAAPKASAFQKVENLKAKLEAAKDDDKTNVDKQLLEARLELATSYPEVGAESQGIKKVKDLKARFEAAQDADKPAIAKELLVAQQALELRVSENIGRTLAGLGTQTEKLFAALYETDDSGYSILSKLEAAAELRNLLNNITSYALEVKPQKTGGNNKTTRKIFSNAKDFYSGGAIISYALFGFDGKIVASGGEFDYVNYERPWDIMKAP